MVIQGIAWLDAGTHEALFQAGIFVRTLKSFLGLKIDCPEEAVYIKNYITCDQLKELAQKLSKTEYGQYLLYLTSDYDAGMY